MKSMIILALTLLSFNSFAKTVVDTQVDEFGQSTATTITLTGSEAKKIWDFLIERSQYTGSFISQDAAMGKSFLSAPGVQCQALNIGHLEGESVNLEKIYRCSLEFGENGAIKI